MAGVLRGPFPKQSPRFHKGNLVAAVPRYGYLIKIFEYKQITRFFFSMGVFFSALLSM
jgi:hypothetical protein